MEHNSHHRPLIGILHRQAYFDITGKLPALVLIFLACIQARYTVDSVLLLLMISRVEMVGHLTNALMEQSNEVTKKMKKVQKLVNLANTIQEVEKGEIEVADDWPRTGNLRTEGVKLRYRPKLELVLKGLDFKVESGIKVGVCGRTGAGKSTLGLTFLRILEIEEGKIFLDDVDISKVSLQTLRERVTTIPQDPALFKGTLRFNIDPHGRYPDSEIESLLSRCGLNEIMKIEEGSDIKEFKIEEGGKNLSDGEK